jgi:hypothetical protein
VKADLATFTQTLFRRTGSNLVDILPNLQTLRIKATVDKIDLSDKKLKKAILKQHPVDVKQELDSDWDCILKGRRIADNYLWMLSPPSEGCDLGDLGTVPAGLVLVCDRIRPGANLSDIQTLHLEHVDDNSDAKSLKTTRLLEVWVNKMIPDGVSRVPNFTNAMLHHLPPTLKRLAVHRSPAFDMPCQFPAGLEVEKLVIQGANFMQPSLEGLPLGLQELVLDLSDGFTEDEYGLYPFPTLDVTDLPPTLTVLKIGGPFTRGDEKSVQLTGTAWPPALATLQLRDDVEVGDALLRSLPAGVTVEKIAASDSDLIVV